MPAPQEQIWQHTERSQFLLKVRQVTKVPEGAEAGENDPDSCSAKLLRALMSLQVTSNVVNQFETEQTRDFPDNVRPVGICFKTCEDREENAAKKEVFAVCLEITPSFITSSVPSKDELLARLANGKALPTSEPRTESHPKIFRIQLGVLTNTSPNSRERTGLHIITCTSCNRIVLEGHFETEAATRFLANGSCILAEGPVLACGALTPIRNHRIPWQGCCRVQGSEKGCEEEEKEEKTKEGEKGRKERQKGQAACKGS